MATSKVNPKQLPMTIELALLLGQAGFSNDDQTSGDTTIVQAVRNLIHERDELRARLAASPEKES